jgi:hypothetical protein
MDDRCPFLDAPGSPPTPGAEAAAAEHLAACPVCRQEAAGDAVLLDAFRSVHPPQLSPFFDRRVLEALARERRIRQTRLRRRRILQLYWLLAAAASIVVVVHLPWREHSLATSPVLLATFAAGAILPVVLLLAALRRDPVDLLFETLDWLS